jgi:hypothetical protein
MRPVALLCLLFGFVGLGFLDGQTFTHAVIGIAFGVTAAACGLVSARRDPPRRWEGWVLAGLGVCLGVCCILQLPSAYVFQKRFNDRKEQRIQRKVEPANKPAAGYAGWAAEITFAGCCLGVPEPGRWAAGWPTWH